jgi:hypothetical protein
MRLSTCALFGALLLAAPPAGAAQPIGYVASDGVNTVAVTAATPLPTTAPASAANIAPNQVSIATTATLIAAARPGRQTITVEQLGATAVYLGGAGVTTGTGAWLPGVAGSSITLNFSGALYGITASGSEAVAEYELY